jgi:hypothetical protein
MTLFLPHQAIISLLLPSSDLSAKEVGSAFSCFPANTDSLEVAVDNFRRLHEIPSESVKISHFNKCLAYHGLLLSYTTDTEVDSPIQAKKESLSY